MHGLGENLSPAEKVNGDGELEIEEGFKFPTSESPYTCQKKVDMGEEDRTKKHQMPPASVMTRLVLIMVWRKLIRNPNTYSSLFGLTWSLVSFRYVASSIIFVVVAVGRCLIMIIIFWLLILHIYYC